MVTCRVLQVYFDEQSKSNCLDNVELIYNDKCTPYFENKIIVDNIDKNTEDYFGVFSPHFKYKILPVAGMSRMSYEYIKTQLDSDVISFFKHHRTKNMIKQAEEYHPRFTIGMELLLSAIGVDLNLNLDTRFIVYQNHFVAKKEVYNDYVENWLKPAIVAMEDKDNSELQNILWQDSNYHKKKNMSDRLKRDLGVNYYPYHTFILERLFSLYLNKNKHITCRHL